MLQCYILDIHLAIIVDNEGEQQVEVGTEKKVSLNAQAERFRVFFKKMKFLVLSFNNISPESIENLFRFFTTSINPDDLAGFVLVSLCKGDACAEFNFENVIFHFLSQEIFIKVNKLFFTHYTKPKKSPIYPAMIPKNSVILSVTSSPKDELLIFQAFSRNFEKAFHSPVKTCFQKFHDEICNNATCVNMNDLGPSYVFSAPYEPQPQM